jgi:hypothetical protein
LLLLLLLLLAWCVLGALLGTLSCLLLLLQIHCLPALVWPLCTPTPPAAYFSQENSY